MPRTLDIRHDSFALTRPFRISRGVRTVAEVITVTLTDDGAAGRGEGTPYPRYGESIETSLAEIAAARTAIEDGVTREELLGIMRAGAARNAVDCALWDLEARQRHTTAAHIAGLPPVGATTTAITISIDDAAAMAAQATALSHVGLLKVKVDAADPLRTVRLIRAAAPAPRLIVDPNESWSIEQLVELLPALAELGVDLLEQPIAAADSEKLRGIPHSVQLCADEAVHGTHDVPALVGLYDFVNIKLDKTGGLTEALLLAAAAREAGLGVMVGCMLSSSLAIAPAMVVAQLGQFADLDGPYQFADDRPGGIRIEDGHIFGPAPGFWGDG